MSQGHLCLKENPKFLSFLHHRGFLILHQTPLHGASEYGTQRQADNMGGFFTLTY
jgi:hypothetical protein